MLRTARDASMVGWMRMNEGEGTRVIFCFGSSPAYASGASVLQIRMVDELREAGLSVHVVIIDSTKLAADFASNVRADVAVRDFGIGIDPPAEDRAGTESTSTEKLVLVIDGIALLFLHPYIDLLCPGGNHSSSRILGSVAVVHVPFSACQEYITEGWIQEAVPPSSANSSSQSPIVSEATQDEADRIAALTERVRQVEEQCFNAVTHIVAVACAHTLQSRYQVPQSAINEIQPDVPHHLPRRSSITAAAPYEFVSVGTLCTRKNQLVLVEALAQCRDIGSWRLHLIGEDKMEERYVESMRARIKELGFGGPAAGSSNQVLLHGAISQAATFQIVADSHLFLFPSLSESFGMALDEAVAIGLPSVVFKGVGPITDILPPSSTVFVQDGTSSKEWASAFRAFHVQSTTLLEEATAEAERRAVKRRKTDSGTSPVTDVVLGFCSE